jgi:hypothetical protein
VVSKKQVANLRALVFVKTRLRQQITESLLAPERLFHDPFVQLPDDGLVR